MKIYLGTVEVEMDEIVSVMPKVQGSEVKLRHGDKIVTTREWREIQTIIEREKEKILTFESIDGGNCSFYVDSVVGVIPYSRSNGERIIFRGSMIRLDGGDKFIICVESKEVLRRISAVLAKGAE